MYNTDNIMNRQSFSAAHLLKKKIPIHPVLRKIGQIFSSNGYTAYLVGGAVRDILRGQPASDWDIATNAPPQAVISMFKKVIPTGIAHGTVTVIFEHIHIEVTTFRTESMYTDGRHPDTVEYAATIEEDLSRRDFTMNAIAALLSTGELIDPFGGRADIAEKIIRTVGDAEERFNEDGLRPVRGIRFASQLDFRITDDTLAAIPKCLERTACISIERFRDEFIKILSSPKPSKALKLLETTGILKIFIPDLVACRGIEQADFRSFHCFDVLDHLFYACDGAPADNLPVRLAALFHDIGKPACKHIQYKIAPDGIRRPINTFLQHEAASSRLARQILLKLRFPNKIIDKVCHLIAQHMFHYEPNWTDAAVRRFIARVGTEYLHDLFDLRIADVYGMTASPPVLKEGLWSAQLIELKDRIAYIQQEQAAITLKELAVNGTNLIALGIPPGKQIGMILQELLDTVLEDPAQNTQDCLLTIAQNIWNERQNVNEQTQEK